MPIAFAEIGQTVVIERIAGSEQIRHHLTELGFTVGSPVTIVTKAGSNMIVKVRETRVALDRRLSMKMFSRA
jgi:ferrous iron transport protein A